MSRKRATTPDLPQWEDICIMVPPGFHAAAAAAAHRYQVTEPEYCRRALLLRLEADGVRIEDFDRAA